jgi:hypothetical protein
VCCGEGESLCEKRGEIFCFVVGRNLGGFSSFLSGSVVRKGERERGGRGEKAEKSPR